MSASEEHYVPAINGEWFFDCGLGFHGNHQLSFRGVDADFGGTLTIAARGHGSNVFEEVIDGIVDLSNIKSVLFVFSVSEYKFTLSGVTGAVASSQILITDIPLEL